MGPLSPVHPGEILIEEFLVRGDSIRAVAERARVQEDDLAEVLALRRRIDPDMAIGLGTAFDMHPAFFINLQLRYDGLAVSQVD